MSHPWRTRGLLVAAAAVFFAGVIALFHRQFAEGDFYPEFSTLRSDPMGAKLLYDSLGKLPGIAVERNFLPMEFLPRDGATLVLLGVSPTQMNWNDDLFLKPVERMAARGNRVVVALYLDPAAAQSAEDLDREEAPKAKSPKQDPKPHVPMEAPLRKLWKVSITVVSGRKDQHPLYFEEADGWKVRDKVGSRVLAIERDFGKGSVVLLAESLDFSNYSTVATDRLRQVSGALGGYQRIVFDEHHLGIAESGSVVGMARQFRLTGLAIGLAICAALFIWRNASSFPPIEAARPGERLSGRTSQAGLLTLLKRHIPPAELAAVCWREWLSVNRGQVSPERRKQAEAILARAGRQPVEATREIQALLHAKGKL